MNTEAEITEMLLEIFRKPELPPQAELPQEMTEIIRKSGISNIPQIVFVENLPNRAWGNVDFNTYNEIVINIATTKEDIITGKSTPRTIQEMTRTLAHELGHWEHIQDGKNYGNAGFKWCEDYADNFRNQLLSQ